MRGKSSKPARARRTFTDEYKREVIALVKKSGKSSHQVAIELDLTPTVVRRWVRQAEIDEGKGPAGALTSAEREELSKLRKEVRELRMQRDILKKAAALFANESK